MVAKGGRTPSYEYPRSKLPEITSECAQLRKRCLHQPTTQYTLPARFSTMIGSNNTKNRLCSELAPSAKKKYIVWVGNVTCRRWDSRWASKSIPTGCKGPQLINYDLNTSTNGYQEENHPTVMVIQPNNNILQFFSLKSPLSSGNASRLSPDEWGKDQHIKTMSTS